MAHIMQCSDDLLGLVHVAPGAVAAMMPVPRGDMRRRPVHAAGALEPRRHEEVHLPLNVLERGERALVRDGALRWWRARVSERVRRVRRSERARNEWRVAERIFFLEKKCIESLFR